MATEQGEIRYVMATERQRWARGIDLPDAAISPEEQARRAEALLATLDSTTAPLKTSGLLGWLSPDPRRQAIERAANQLNELLLRHGSQAWERGGRGRYPGPNADCIKATLQKIMEPVDRAAGADATAARLQVFNRVSAFAHSQEGKPSPYTGGHFGIYEISDSLWALGRGLGL